jgi:hypothetical protein
LIGWFISGGGILATKKGSFHVPDIQHCHITYGNVPLLLGGSVIHQSVDALAQTIATPCLELHPNVTTTTTTATTATTATTRHYCLSPSNLNDPQTTEAGTQACSDNDQASKKMETTDG